MTNVVQLRSKRRGAVDEGGGDLAGLIRLYFQQIAADDAAPDETDEEGDARRAATFEATLERIEETPVRNREDAFAAIEWFFSKKRQTTTHEQKFHSPV